MGCPSPLTLSPFVPHGAREKYRRITFLSPKRMAPSPHDEPAFAKTLRRGRGMGRGYGERIRRKTSRIETMNRPGHSFARWKARPPARWKRAIQIGNLRYGRRR